MKSPDKSQVMHPVPYAALRRPFLLRVREAMRRLWCRVLRHPLKLEETASDIGMLRSMHCLKCWRSWWL